MLNDRFQFMIRRLKTRKYNVWERISEFFICSYYFIINIALHHIKNMIIPYIRSSDKVMTPFTVLQRTAKHFKHFLDEVQADTRTNIMGNLSNSRES
jgi:hypothetical protein